MKLLLIHKGLWKTTTGEGRAEDSVDQKALALICLNVKDHHIVAQYAYQSLWYAYPYRSYPYSPPPDNAGHVQDSQGSMGHPGEDLQDKERCEEATTEEGA